VDWSALRRLENIRDTFLRINMEIFDAAASALMMLLLAGAAILIIRRQMA